MWTEQSYPISTLIGVVNPIIADNPKLDQPPKLVNSTKTCGCARGAITQRGIIITKMPAKCNIKTIPSMSGNRAANTVLKTTAKPIIAMVKSVPCQLCHV